jgi:hypothetical protein
MIHEYTYSQGKVYLRAAKRRVFDSLKSDGIEINGHKHQDLVITYLNRNDIIKPVGVKLNTFLIGLYLSGELGHITLIPKIKRTLSKDKTTYHEYLKSDRWRKFRKEVFEFYGKNCILCDSPFNVEVHHKHYRTIFKETIKDVVPLCKKCHTKHHSKRFTKKNKK